MIPTKRFISKIFKLFRVWKDKILFGSSGTCLGPRKSKWTCGMNLSEVLISQENQDFVSSGSFRNSSSLKFFSYLYKEKSIQNFFGSEIKNDSNNFKWKSFILNFFQRWHYFVLNLELWRCVNFFFETFLLWVAWLLMRDELWVYLGAKYWTEYEDIENWFQFI